MGQDALLCTVDALIRDMGIAASLITDSVRYRLRAHIEAASRVITQGSKRYFVPTYQAKLFDALGEHVSTYRLSLGKNDLLEIVTLTNGNGTVITAGNYVLKPDNDYPKVIIQLKTSSGVSWTYNTSWEQAISVAGFWGYHEGYEGAWIDTNENVPTGGLTSSATSFTASDADGKDERYRPRFEDGLYLRIENEILQVAAVNTTSNLVTVLRGQQGTTAAAHAQTTDIKSWAVQSDIEQACLGLSTFYERNRGTIGEVAQMPDGTEIDLSRAPDYVKRTIMA